ncbi:MAG: arsenate reductase ArsC [Chloroflexota bacterium]|nr:MAG: arsenate reductase ArsC [Chloroflexota bacterium]
MPVVLFVCVHNAGRSQMAEAFFNQIAQERHLHARAESAGTEPGDHVHPEVAAAMRELGIDLTAKRPKLLTDKLIKESQRVITMGCAPDAAACPAILLRDVEDWALPDPHSQPLRRVREIRDQVRRRVLQLVEQIERTDIEDAPPIDQGD